MIGSHAEGTTLEVPHMWREWEPVTDACTAVLVVLNLPLDPEGILRCGPPYTRRSGCVGAWFLPGYGGWFHFMGWTCS